MQRENDATKDCDLRFAISEAAKSVRRRRILLCEEWFLLRLRALLLRAEAGMIECWHVSIHVCNRFGIAIHELIADVG